MVQNVLRWHDTKTSWIEKAYVWLLVGVLFGVVLHAPISVGFGSLWPDAALLIKSWKEILLGVAALLLVVILTTRRQWQIFNTKLFYLLILFAGINLALIPVFYTGIEATLAGLLINLRFLLMFSLVYAAVRLFPKTVRLFIAAAVSGALLVVTFAALQMTVLPDDALKHIGYGESTIAPYQTIDENDEYVRINSTLRGPNPLGAFMVIALSLGVAFIASTRRKFTSAQYGVFSLIGVAGLATLWSSYSRSALVAGIAAMGLALLLIYGRRIHRWVWFGVAAAGLLLAGGLVVAKDTHFVSHVLLHEDPNEGGEINSNDMHHESFMIGVERMLVQPLGGGIGSTGSASMMSDETLIIENQYLFIAHEVGWLGLAVFLAIFLMILWQLWKQRSDWLSVAVLASGIGLAAIGMVLPVWVDDTVSIVWWALAAVALGAAHRVRSVKKGALNV